MADNTADVVRLADDDDVDDDDDVRGSVLPPSGDEDAPSPPPESEIISEQQQPTDFPLQYQGQDGMFNGEVEDDAYRPQQGHGGMGDGAENGGDESNNHNHNNNHRNMEEAVTFFDYIPAEPLPFPGFVPVSFMCLRQSSRIRSICLRLMLSR
ncbi:hypothetical protein BV898_02314 [Hypsibius exemplaris]|uniref:Uncharacterized protein n=1 Tax=Hypsibius exemplaris TaxID=2072580 RepID=A0A1W0X987_HYPEX|nr:hypothetical protein BV898_02314 [Hypsibius exemplaris]